MRNHDYDLPKALREIERLERENTYLKQLMHQHNVALNMNTDNETAFDSGREKKIKERIRLYRSLFKGREDVFAIRWSSGKGDAGYAPARNDQSNKTDLKPLTDQIIYNHLSGKQTIGIYPILRDNTCSFLVMDFDKKQWQKDANAFVNTCDTYDLPAYRERSRSGDGCHIWIFFRKRIPADLARKLGDFLFSRTLEKSSSTDLASFDRMFPSQGALPEGGFGNLIALPLQQVPRKKDNSVFIDENGHAYTAQWLFLSRIEKVSKAHVEQLIEVANSEANIQLVGESFPQVEGTPKKLYVIYKNAMYIKKNQLPEHIMQEISSLAKFSNPAYYKAKNSRLSTNRIPRIIDSSESEDGYLILPRGCMDTLKILLVDNAIELDVEDQSNPGKSIRAEFYGHLSIKQDEAMHHLLQERTGILSAATGFGKTVVAAALIAKRKTNTLIIVHRKHLMDQWKEHLAAFLNVGPETIGQIGGGKTKPNGNIDVATAQSLNHKGVVKDAITTYGQIIADECHHYAAAYFEDVLKKVNAKYVHGLTATSTRKDQLQKIMFMQCGNIRYKVTPKEQAKMRPFKHVSIPRYTSFKSSNNEKGNATIQDLFKDLMESQGRNEMIFNDVLKELEKGSSPLILTERVEHVKKLEEMFKKFAKNIVVLTGRMGKKEEKNKLSFLNELSDEQERLVISTGKYIGEGFDNARLDRLFLTMPITWKGTLQQYVGRLHRHHDLKKAVKVYDYVDDQVPVFKKMFDKRKAGYKTLGYTIQNSDPETKSTTQQMRLF